MIKALMAWMHISAIDNCLRCIPSAYLFYIYHEINAHTLEAVAQQAAFITPFICLPSALLFP